MPVSRPYNLTLWGFVLCVSFGYHAFMLSCLSPLSVNSIGCLSMLGEGHIRRDVLPPGKWKVSYNFLHSSDFFAPIWGFFILEMSCFCKGCCIIWVPADNSKLWDEPSPPPPEIYAFALCPGYNQFFISLVVIHSVISLLFTLFHSHLILICWHACPIFPWSYTECTGHFPSVPC